MANMALPNLTAVIQRDEEDLTDGTPVWVAHCPELDVTTQGFSVEHAQAMLQEAVELLFEVAEDEEIERRLRNGARVVPLKLAA